MAKITVSLLRDLEQKTIKGEISYSQMVEMLNEHAKFGQINETLYFKVIPGRVAYKGNRYFKHTATKIIQVCLEIENETKRGKGHYIGIYPVTRNTFMGNWFNYLESCSEDEYSQAFNKAIELLRDGKI